MEKGGQADVDEIKVGFLGEHFVQAGVGMGAVIFLQALGADIADGLQGEVKALIFQILISLPVLPGDISVAENGCFHKDSSLNYG